MRSSECSIVDAASIAVERSHRRAKTDGGFRSEVQPRRQHWFLDEKSGFPFRTPAFCSVSRGQRRLGEKEYRAPSVAPGVALRPRTQEFSSLKCVGSAFIQAFWRCPVCNRSFKSVSMNTDCGVEGPNARQPPSRPEFL